jgi:hypothetical protein
MSHLSTTLRIEASATDVFDLVADPARSPDWHTLLVAMGDIAGRPGGIGSSFAGYYRVAGRKLAGHFVVTAAERPTLFQVNGTTTGGWARWTTMIEPGEACCVVQVTLEYELPGEIVGSLLGLLTGRRIEREFRQTYDNLKRLAETGSAEPRTIDVNFPSAHAAAMASLRSTSDELDAGEPGGQLAPT